MRVSVLGLGYVGTVTAACLASEGHEVIGVDTSPGKVKAISSGQSPIVEPGLPELTAEMVARGLLAATDDTEAAVHASDISMICVGTPSDDEGRLDLQHIRSVASKIGNALASKREHHTVVVRSTVLPGTTRTVVVPEIERSSGKHAGNDFDVCFNPEFLREGSSIDDYRNPPKVVVGTESGKPNDQVNSLYASVRALRVNTTLEFAELTKYVDNSWHALKVTYANEIGRIAKSLGIDGRDVMELLTQDTKLNLSANYLRPGFAYGGSCLPKDVSALLGLARDTNVETPLIAAIDASNQTHIQAAIAAVLGIGRRRAGVLGISFKPFTDDVRNSPSLYLISALLGAGMEVRIFDPNIRYDKLMGANREFIQNHIPFFESLLVPSIRDLDEFAEVLVLTKDEPALTDAAMRTRPDQVLVDLAGLGEEPAEGEYVGIAW